MLAWRWLNVQSTSTYKGSPPNVAQIFNESPGLTGHFDPVTESLLLKSETQLLLLGCTLGYLRDTDTTFASAVRGLISLNDLLCLLDAAEKALPVSNCLLHTLYILNTPLVDFLPWR